MLNSACIAATAMAFSTERKISIWWDMESCPFPHNIIDPQILARLNKALLYIFRINGYVQRFCAYENFDRVDKTVKQTLVNSAVGLRHVPPGGKETVEKALLVDVLCWSIDEPPPAFVVFIIGNIDLSNVIHRLSQRTYGVLLVCDCALRMGETMLAGVIEWVEWRSVLQLLPVVDFDATRDMIIPAYTESPYFNPMAAVPYTENVFSSSTFTGNCRPYIEYIPSPTIQMDWPFTDYRWYSEYNHENYPSLPCQMPYDLYINGQIAISELHSTSYMQQFATEDYQNVPVFYTRNYGLSNMQIKASMADVKSWLLQFLKECGRKGCRISVIYKEFNKATGKVIDLNYLGFPKLAKLLEEFRDVALLKRVYTSDVFIFPVETELENEYGEGINYDPAGKTKDESCDVNAGKNENVAVEYERENFCPIISIPTGLEELLVPIKSFPSAELLNPSLEDENMKKTQRDEIARKGRYRPSRLRIGVVSVSLILLFSMLGWNVVPEAWPLKKKTSKIIQPKLAKEA